MKKHLILSLIFLLLSAESCSLVSLFSGTINPNAYRVAIFLPDYNINPRWYTDKTELHEVLIQYNTADTIYLADEQNGADIQIEQIKDAITKGFKNFILTPIDFEKINESKVLDSLYGFNIICHDRMIYDNTFIKYFSGCDGKEIGRLQAQWLVEQYISSGKASMHLEMMAGPRSDRNSKMFFDGALEVLKPYIESGKLLVQKDKADFNQVSLEVWSADAAYTEMLKRIDTAEAVELILAPNDNTAKGIIKACEEKGINPQSLSITGQDNTSDAQELMKEGKLGMTIDKSVKEMSSNSALIMINLMKGAIPVSSYYVESGERRIPFIKTTPIIITKE